MIIILLKDVAGLGRAGEVVKVSDGYARNKLFPSGVAMQATDSNIRSLEKQKKVLEDKRQKEKNAAKEQADRMSRLTVDVYSKSGENGRLFGSITSKDIADAIKSQHRIDVDKRKIVMEAPIKNVGETQIEIRLYPDVVAHMTVSVKSNEGTK